MQFYVQWPLHSVGYSATKVQAIVGELWASHLKSARDKQVIPNSVLKHCKKNSALKMETSYINESTIEHAQILAKCNISKEDLTDTMEYFHDVTYENKPHISQNNKDYETISAVKVEFIKKEPDEAYELPQKKPDEEYELQWKKPDKNYEAPQKELDENYQPLQKEFDKDYKPPQEVLTYKKVPFDVKLKIVMTANEHPRWTFRTLQRRFKKHLHHNSDIARFKKDILSSGNFRNKLELIKKNVHDRFIEARQNKQLVTRRILQQWAIAAAAQYHDNQKNNEGQKCFPFYSIEHVVDFISMQAQNL